MDYHETLTIETICVYVENKIYSGLYIFQDVVFSTPTICSICGFCDVKSWIKF